MNIEKVSLETIAFLIAREKYPEFDFQKYSERLDEFARRARLRVGQVLGGRQIAQGLSHYLFEEEGFRGNKDDYYNPANSFLNDVLDTRQGIPITLAIVYIAVAERLGLPVFGVGFPGHFLIRYEDSEETFFIDTFHGGKILSAEDCEERFLENFGEAFPFHAEFLEASSRHEIVLRMLVNLKMVFVMKKDYTMALQFLNRILLFKPEGGDEVKERGMIYYSLECFGAALQDLQSYLLQNPKASDRSTIENYIEELNGKVAAIQ